MRSKVTHRRRLICSQLIQTDKNLQILVSKRLDWHIVVALSAGVQTVVDETLEHVASRPAMDAIRFMSLSW